MQKNSIEIDGTPYKLAVPVYELLKEISEERDFYRDKVLEANKWLECDQLFFNSKDLELAENLGLKADITVIKVPAIINLSEVRDFRMSISEDGKLEHYYTHIKYNTGEGVTLNVPFEDFKKLFYEFKGTNKLIE